MAEIKEIEINGEVYNIEDDDESDIYAKKTDVENTYAKKVDVENTYAKKTDIPTDIENTYAKKVDVENTYVKKTDIESGTIVAKKAECDSSGNKIEDTYMKIDDFSGHNVGIVQTMGDSETAAMSQKAATEQFVTIERNNKYTEEKNVSWENGGLASVNGNTQVNSKRLRTDFIQNLNLLIRIPSDKKVDIFYYDINNKYISHADYGTGIVYTNGSYTPSHARFLRLLFGYSDDREITNTVDAVNNVEIYEAVYEESELLMLFEIGTIDATGAVTANRSRIVTNQMLPVQSLYFVPEENVKFLVSFYNDSYTFLERTSFIDTATFIENIAPNDAAYFKIVVADVSDTDISTLIGEYAAKFHAYIASSNEYRDVCFKENKTAIEENKTAIEENKKAIEILGNSIFSKAMDVKFVIGGLQVSTDGYENDLTNRVRTDFIDDVFMKISADDGVKIGVCFYDKNDKYISGFGMTTIYPLYVTNHAPDGTKKVRIVAAYSSNENISNIDDMTAKIDIKTVEFSSEQSEYESDIPENIGVLNAILNFKQLVEVEYTTKAVIPHATDGFTSVGKKYNGLPYSSTRPEALFVPNNVSLHTFMTALKNPNSYLYTVDLGEQGNVNGDTYYGAVCSTSVEYALGIIPMYSTHQWTQIPDMEAIENQSAYGLKLCDTIVGSGHVVMVTDITRNKRGKIGHITITEAANPRCMSRNYTPEELEARFPPSVYTYCRYEKLYAVKHEQSPYVSVEDEIAQTVTYNTAIIPRKGDKANWLVGKDVEIDVLEAGSYTSVEIYKDGVLYDTKAIAPLITLSGLAFGSYKARLTDGTNTSDWCYWMVVDAVSNATAAGANGQANVTFSASNATPLWVQWASGTGNGTEHISLLSDGEIASGSAICTHKAGTFKVRVAFQTEYGIVHSELPNAITIS